MTTLFHAKLNRRFTKMKYNLRGSFSKAVIFQNTIIISPIFGNSNRNRIYTS